MAVCIMFGLTFAAILFILEAFVLYAMFFNIREPDRQDGVTAKVQ